ncbi:uncharacterized protein HD556DRAFT_1313741 [Suillus plorans]|uniref:Uncharacterized protein n=1 Tax=Suillus plorans TaxID=116603 RepID=A0A9P7DBH1_9AGAM|nr:uncharacterized protein HD556DRAFT_1313741 [Suillus plorans]KAG1786067.1 hypothetical protein HD556DRAFT_1313741 [Suillus plorans]
MKSAPKTLGYPRMSTILMDKPLAASRVTGRARVRVNLRFIADGCGGYGYSVDYGDPHVHRAYPSRFTVLDGLVPYRFIASSLVYFNASTVMIHFKKRRQHSMKLDDHIAHPSLELDVKGRAGQREMWIPSSEGCGSGGSGAVTEIVVESHMLGK